jgi:hypothetical protein
MKVYISNILPKELNKKDICTILNKRIDNLYVESKELIEIYSKEMGYYVINYTNVFKVISPVKQMFEQIKNYNKTQFDLLFDLSKYEYVNIPSHIPQQYIYTKIIETSYKTNKLSKIALKIKYAQDKDTTCMIPIDYYIELDELKILSVKEFLDDIFLNEDFNMLLFGLKEYL